jgi:ribonuclease HI
MISVFCDGSSASSGGKPGGWAFVIVRDEKQVLVANYGGHPSCTNNVMELTAAIRGLEALKELMDKDIVSFSEVRELVSDSQYTLNMANGGWTPSVDSEGNVKNGALIEDLRGLARNLLSEDAVLSSNIHLKRPRTRWVPGHTGNTWNEKCDSLAKKGKEEAKRGLHGNRDRT